MSELKFKGGVHLCVIRKAEDIGNAIKLVLDVDDKNDKFYKFFSKEAEGDFSKWKKCAIAALWKTNRFKKDHETEDFENNINAIKLSNPNSVIDLRNVSSLEGLQVVCVWRKEEWLDTNNNNEIKPFYKPHHLASRQEWIQGLVLPQHDYLKYSEPYKPKYPKNNYGEQNVNVNIPTPQPNNDPFQAAAPKHDIYDDIPDDDVPF